MIDENLRRKIQKLFAMAERGEGNEAEVALKKAWLLMQSSGITQDDAELFIVEIPDTSKRKARWVKQLHEICAAFCGCVSLYSTKSYTFAGDEIGVNVGRELFFYLKNEIIRQTDKKQLCGQKLKNDFRIGVVYGLNERMKECGGWRDMQDKRRRVEEKHFSENAHGTFSMRFVSDCFEAGKKKAADINLSRQAGYAAAGLLTGGAV